MEASRLRVKDLRFECVEILVRDGKGEKDRRAILPRPLLEALRRVRPGEFLDVLESGVGLGRKQVFMRSVAGKPTEGIDGQP
jgi:hypothetical protein